MSAKTALDLSRNIWDTSPRVEIGFPGLRVTRLMSARSYRLLMLAVSCTCLSLLTGCQTPGWGWYEKLKGPGFSSWNDSLSGGMRGQNSDAKPSGFLYDKRSEQIEKNLGVGA
jgi:hypothetical protein